MKKALSNVLNGTNKEEMEMKNKNEENSEIIKQLETGSDGVLLENVDYVWP